MSQPPPPPSQPPAGGFGPPPPDDEQQPSPPPGYGYPQQPPQPPPAGYGYPQQPPAQPPQPPQQPYGQQPYGQQPYGQPQYGYPQQPAGHPTPVVPGPPLPAKPGGGGGGVPVWAIVLAVVAIVVAASGTGWYLTRDDGGGEQAQPKDDKQQSVTQNRPESAEGELLFDVPYPQVGETDTFPVTGHWATEKIYAKSGINEVKGYDAQTGDEKWQLPTDGLVCGASRRVTEDGKTAMLVQDGKVQPGEGAYRPCTEVVFFDINTGKELWQQHVASADENVTFEHITIAGDLVVASGLDGSVAYPLAGGDPKWQTKPTAECTDYDYASDGTNLLALLFCGSTIDEDLRVQKVDPASGNTLWSYDVPDGVQSVQVLSVEPPVITIGAGKTTQTDIFALKDGELRSKISLGTETLGPRYNPGCDYSGGAESCTTVATHGDTMFLPSREHQGKSDYGRTNEVVAFDLATGKPTKKFDAGEKRTMVPLRMEGDKLVAYRKPTYDSGGEIVAIDPSSGKEETWLRLPTDTAEQETTMSLSDRVPYLFEHGRFYLGQDLVSNRDDMDSLALAFGSESG